MNNKTTYSFALGDLNKSEVNNLFKLSRKKDRTAIGVELAKGNIQIRNVKEDKYYTAIINSNLSAETTISSFKNKDGIELLNSELEAVAELIPEYVIHIINVFNITSGDFYFKILHPILIFTDEGMEIQLDIYMIYFENRVYFLIEPLDFANNGVDLVKDIHEIKIKKYLVMDNTDAELENAHKLLEQNISNRIHKNRYFWNICLKCFGEERFKERLKEISINEKDKVFQKEVEVKNIDIGMLLMEYYGINTSLYMINNYFTDNNSDSLSTLYSMQDYMEFKSQNGVKKIISPYYNISIYDKYTDKDKFFIENTVEGLLILSVFTKYSCIFDSNELNPHELSKSLGINMIADYENLTPYFYDFYEKIIQLKQFKRLENKLKLKQQYSTACYEKEMLKYQKRSNIAIIILTIISTIAAVASIG